MSVDPEAPLVFVYGTLREGFTNRGRDVLTLHGEFVGRARVPGRLYDLGDFPAMTEPTAEDDRVVGEIHRLTRQPDEALERLDRYEGARGSSPLPYERREVPFELDDGSTGQAWAYVWTDDVDGFPEVEGGDWVEHVRPDSRR